MFRIDETLKDFAPYVVYGVVSAFRGEEDAPTIHVTVLTTQNTNAGIRGQIRRAIEKKLGYRERNAIAFAFGVVDDREPYPDVTGPIRLLLDVRKAKADDL